MRLIILSKPTVAMIVSLNTMDALRMREGMLVVQRSILRGRPVT